MKDLDLGLLDFPALRDGRRGRALLARRRGRRRVLARRRRGLRGPETDRLGRIELRCPTSGSGCSIAVGVIVLVDDRGEARRPADRAGATSRPRRDPLPRAAPPIVAAIVFVGVLSALLVIPQVRAVAGGVLASSAVIGLVIGFASQRTIGNCRRGRPDRVHAAAPARRRGRGRGHAGRRRGDRPHLHVDPHARQRPARRPEREARLGDDPQLDDPQPATLAEVTVAGAR